MATTLSKGYSKPANGDRGSVFYPALATDIQLMNDHIHDGSTGAAFASKYVTRGTVSSAGSGYAASGNYFTKTITFPSGYLWSNCSVQMFLTSSGEQIFPRFEKLTTSTGKVYMPIDALAVTYIFT